MTEWGKCYLQNLSRKCSLSQSETLDFQNFCILLGTHSQFGLDPGLLQVTKVFFGVSHIFQFINPIQVFACLY